MHFMKQLTIDHWIRHILKTIEQEGTISYKKVFQFSFRAGFIFWWYRVTTEKQ